MAASDFRVELSEFEGKVVTFDPSRLTEPQMMESKRNEQSTNTVVRYLIVARISTDLLLLDCVG